MRGSGKAFPPRDEWKVDPRGRDQRTDGTTPPSVSLGPWSLDRARTTTAPGWPQDALVDGWFKTGDIVPLDEYGCSSSSIGRRTSSSRAASGSPRWTSRTRSWPTPPSRGRGRRRTRQPMGRAPIGGRVARTGAHTSPTELREHLAQQFAKWQLPDRFEFVAAIPCTATGKFKKTQLRDQFAPA